MMTASHAQRFWAKVDIGDVESCWEWQASKLTGGYGQFVRDGRPHTAHRVAYELAVGPIPAGLHLDHLCRNRSCVNPAHLEPVTPAENNRRARATVTHCPQGHAYDAENTYVYTGRGSEVRMCRTCHRERERARKRRLASLVG